MAIIHESNNPKIQISGENWLLISDLYFLFPCDSAAADGTMPRILQRHGCSKVWIFKDLARIGVS